MLAFNTPDVNERFWSKAYLDENTACWLWRSNFHRQGYGFFKVEGKNMLAHRVGYMLSNDVALPSTVKLLHACDTPGCVNPDHLREGTQQDNALDMVAKGRHVGTSKLSDDQVRAIRKDPRLGVDIEKEMGLSGGTVSRIKSGKRYSRVSD